MQSRDNIRFTCWLDVSLNAFPKLLFDWSERARMKIPTALPEVNKDRSQMQQTAHCYYREMTARVDSPNLLTTPSVSATCHAKPQTLPHPIMHSVADYGSWFSPKMHSSFCSWVCLRSDRVLTTNEPLQGSLESEHIFKEVSVRFFGAPECDCCTLTGPNGPHQEEKTNSSAIQHY